MVYSFSLFWRHFDLVKQVKCAVIRHFRDNLWEEWAEIGHVRLYLVMSQKWKKANISTWKSSSSYWGGGGWGVSLTTVHSDFSSFLLLSPYKTIAFHNTTKDRNCYIIDV